MMNIQWYPCFLKRKTFYLLTLAVFAYIAHMQYILNADVASLLYDTELFLSGGTYVKDFFETNPPMIFILYTPIVLFHKLTSFNIVSLTYFYFILIAFISLGFCHVLIKNILSEEDVYLKNAIICVLAYTFFIASLNDFGQREHLLFIFCMPYLFALVCRAKNLAISRAQACLIGLMAGLVFSLKPFFLIPLILVELYLMVVKKSIKTWLRPESLMVLGIMVGYITYVFAYHPLYFNVLMPLISRFYFIGTEEYWSSIFTRPRVIFCFSVAAYYLFSLHAKQFRELSQVLSLALVGFILAFMVPRSAWSYHVFPAYGVALVLTVIYIYSIWSKEIKQHTLKKKEIIFIIVASCTMPILIFTKEMFQIFQVYQYKDYNALQARAKTLPYHSFYCFSTLTTGLCFPLVTINNKKFGGRFPMFWWIRGLRKIEDKYGNQLLPEDILSAKAFLLDALAHDLNHYQPEVIIAYKGDEKFFLPKGYDYPMYFSGNENFKQAWLHYQLLENIGSFTLYRRI